MTRFTFLEVHFEGDAQFGPESIATGGQSDESDAATAAEDAIGEWDASGPDPTGFVVGLVVLALVFVAVRRLVGGSSDGDDSGGDADEDR